MSRFYLCDQCEHTQEEALVYRLSQITDELDDDGDQVCVTLHFCSTACLCNYAMAIALDLPDV